jgi:hypothetical protein
MVDRRKGEEGRIQRPTADDIGIASVANLSAAAAAASAAAAAAAAAVDVAAADVGTCRRPADTDPLQDVSARNFTGKARFLFRMPFRGDLGR